MSSEFPDSSELDDGPIEGKTGDSPADSPRNSCLTQTALPQPGLLAAIAWALLPGFSQLLVAGAALLPVVFLLETFGRAQEVPVFVNDTYPLLVFPLGTLTTLLVGGAVCLAFFGRSTARTIAWRNCHAVQWLLVVLFVIPQVVLASEVSHLATELISAIAPEGVLRTQESGTLLIEMLAGRSWLILLVVGCVLPGLGEELFCRGFLSRGLVARYGRIIGTLLTAGLFGLMHLEPIQASAVFVLGIGLQYVYLTTRSLPAAVVLHACNNALALTLMRFSDRLSIVGMTPTDTGIVHVSPLLCCTAAMSLGSLAWALYRRRTRWILPDGTAWSPGYTSVEEPPASQLAVARSERTGWACVMLVAICYMSMLTAIAQAAGWL